MNQRSVSTLRSWFLEYVEAFRSKSPGDTAPFDLKADHTHRVCREILDIGGSLNLSEGNLSLAEIMALFHDIGRFEQYARYGTFADYKSVNHATLGVRVLHRHAVLTHLPRTKRNLVLRVIAYHNRLGLPENESEACLFFTRLLRDADKVDIWRVFTDYYHRKGEPRNGTIELDLPDIPGVSEEACTELLAGRIVKLRAIKTLNDFKVLQMSWIYDVNFRRTFEIIRKRDYMAMIRQVLPALGIVEEIYLAVKAYVDRQCLHADDSGLKDTI